MKSNLYAILLTACVNPNGMSNTVLQDKVERKRQYVDALNYYLVTTSLPIVFVENSNTDFSNEFCTWINLGRLEYITFDGNSYFDKKKGKGYGEALMLLHAVATSVFISQTKYIIKISGRLIVQNINELLSCNLIKYKSNLWRCNFEQKKFAITTVFICNPNILSCILERHKEQISEEPKGENWIENIIYKSFVEDKKMDICFVPFSINPFFNAKSGTSNSDYIIKPDHINTMDNLYELYYLLKKRGDFFCSMLVYSLYFLFMTKTRLKYAFINNHNKL